MRPSRRLIALVLALAAATVLIGLIRQDGNLIAGVLWGAVALVALFDLLLSPAARNFAISADLADNGFVGSTTPLGLTVTARKGTLPRHIEIRLAHGPELAMPAPTILLEPQAGQIAAQSDIPLTLLERGTARINRLSLRFASRLGLFEILPALSLDLKIDIAPDIAPVLNGEIHTQMLPLIDGLKDVNLKGEGSEFRQLREFQIGMDPRSIDWKRSARMRNLVARETHAERNHQIILCLDTGYLMGERIGNLSKLDHSINASLALAWAGGLGGDNVGFYSFDSRPHQFIPPRPGRRAFGHIQKHCATIQQETAETNHTLGLTQLNGTLARRSLVVVFSDFVDSVTAELLAENLAVITRQHLVLYVALRDPELHSIAHSTDVSMGAIAKAVSAQQLMRERRAVLDRLRRLGILCLDSAPEQLTASLISRYIDIKSQELI